MTDPLVSEHDPETGSEFGGVPGMIQPPPHEPTPSERLRQLYQISTQDLETTVDVE
jgi:hypothetical protein